MAFTNKWDVAVPADTELANLLGQNLRDFRLDVQERMGAISGADAAKPDFASDIQPSNWSGVVFLATDTGKIYQFNGTTWDDKTSVFLTSSVLRYTVLGCSTSGNGQVWATITVPAGVLKAGSIIELYVAGSFSGSLLGHLYLNTTYTGTGFGQASINPSRILVVSTTSCVITDQEWSVVASMPSTETTSPVAVSDLSTNALDIIIKQSNAGNLTGTVSAIVVP